MASRHFASMLFVLMAVACSNASETAPLSPTPIPLSDLLPTQTSTRQPTEIALPTAMSTLSALDAETKVVELLETNGNCELPCWWGIEPGSTSWLEASNYLQSFAKTIVSLERPEFPETMGYFEVTFVVPEEIKRRGELTQTYFVENGIVEKIKTETSITLSQYIERLGRPKEIWVRTVPASLEGYLEFWVAIYYPDRRIAAVFLDEKSQLEDGNITGCFDVTYDLFLWSTSQSVTLVDIPWLGSEKWPTNPTFEEATGRTLDDFYSSILSHPGKTCLTTPAALWTWPTQ